MIDKTRRKIRLTRKQWSHIRREHPNIDNHGEILETVQKPDKVLMDERENVTNFYKYFKHKEQKSKFLKVIVKYLNGEGFIISVYFLRVIK
ncbi:MAG: hypothetical protein AABW50_01370 [Nanoarchaeota archaeon]